MIAAAREQGLAIVTGDTKVVERFVGVHPGKGCPPVPRSPAAAAPAMGRPR
jgi:hypothetical protein